MKLHRLGHSRTGDKGDTSNISIIAYRAEDYPLLCEQLTAERVALNFMQRLSGVASLAAKVGSGAAPSVGTAQRQLREITHNKWSKEWLAKIARRPIRRVQTPQPLDMRRQLRSHPLRQHRHPILETFAFGDELFELRRFGGQTLPPVEQAAAHGTVEQQVHFRLRLDFGRIR